MWNDPIVEETRRLRDEYSAKHNYSIHEMVEDLNQWEKQGCPIPADLDSNALQPFVETASKIEKMRWTIETSPIIRMSFDDK